MVNWSAGRKSSNEGSPAFWPILTRRTATVTICAPLASIAARVSAKSLYLPVPTSRRDWYGLPAMMRLSRFSLGFMKADPHFRASSLRALSAAGNDRGQSAAAHRNDDFKRVAVGEHLVGVTAARHDFAIALERDAL